MNLYPEESPSAKEIFSSSDSVSESTGFRALAIISSSDTNGSSTVSFWKDNQSSKLSLDQCVGITLSAVLAKLSSSLTLL